MSRAPKNVLNDPDRRSFAEELATGRLSWDLIYPFPARSAGEAGDGDRAVAELARLLPELVDPAEVERTHRLPDGAIDRLAEGGWLALGVPVESGGRGLSPDNVFRVVHAAASWSVPVAQVMAVESAIGLSALLPAVGEGPLRAELLELIAAGARSASADTEPSGAANQSRQTTATLVEDGTAYRLTGEKIHIGNGSIAQTFIVSATVTEPDGSARRRLFVVDADSPGLTVGPEHEFMGLWGFPNAALTFTDVRVPAGRLIEESSDPDVRLTSTLLRLVVTGRMYLIAAPAVALARRAAQWARTFVAPRVVDGRPLADYELVARLVADNLADTYALDTLVAWCLTERGSGGQAGELNRLPELMAAKNITSQTGWRVLDRTMSLLAGEGFETAASKARRGAAPLPLERAYRDARGFRISGGVDFLLDYWATAMFTLSHQDGSADEPDEEPDVSWCAEVALSPANQEQLAGLVGQASRFGRTVRLVLAGTQDRAALLARQHELRILNQILDEITTAALVLARAASTGTAEESDLAEVAAGAARVRLDGFWAELSRVHTGPAGPHPAVTRRWLDGTGSSRLEADLIGAGPTGTNLIDAETAGLAATGSPQAESAGATGRPA